MSMACSYSSNTRTAAIYLFSEVVSKDVFAQRAMILCLFVVSISYLLVYIVKVAFHIMCFGHKKQGILVR